MCQLTLPLEDRGAAACWIQIWGIPGLSAICLGHIQMTLVLGVDHRSWFMWFLRICQEKCILNVMVCKGMHFTYWESLSTWPYHSPVCVLVAFHVVLELCFVLLYFFYLLFNEIFFFFFFFFIPRKSPVRLAGVLRGVVSAELQGNLSGITSVDRGPSQLYFRTPVIPKLPSVIEDLIAFIDLSLS